MEKIAILSDIHGNITALKAVLQDIKKRKVNQIIGIGDYVVKCANPDLVIDMIQKNFDVVLKGNCDETISSARALTNKFWSRMKIGEERAEYLRNLPVAYEFYLSGQLVRLFHASPYSLDQIYNPIYSNQDTCYRDKELPHIADMFTNTDFIGKKETDQQPDIVGYGHLHTPNLYKYQNKTVFNTGSVGIPNEMENKGKDEKTNSFSTLASYVILEGNLDSKKLGPISITNIRIPYDIQQEIAYLEQSDMPSKEKIIFTLKTASINFKKE